ncbi:PLC-like phosphodiesterase [Penicillium angulare]|uniref:PLC-like phosphodiesterase n=1 Tax=Penicillium angulare TaxID=116970 RepID=UPI0025414334|nr:PLC-like phosphodiesterase [Penicillium angulare]KAJ5287070.1 PLC-like phosphodiesterase [Penicillium angulare]
MKVSTKILPLWALCILQSGFVAAESTTETDTATTSTASTESSASGTSGISDTVVIYVTSESSVAVPTGDYITYSNTDTFSSAALNATTTGNSTITTSATDVVIVGTASSNSNSTATTSSSTATNTQACNGHVDFCSRKYSNITMVTAHNSPFVKKNNIAANQDYTVTTQLDDGIRMVSFEAHYYEDEIYLCHTSCSLLNMGTLEAYLTTITKWIKKNPFEVVAILIVNSDYVSPGNFSGPIQNSGLIDYVYEPSKVPMSLDDWPTLSEMILHGERAVVFMDYEADQTDYPYILDEFSQMWETPFSPLNRSFPCTAQRPPGLSTANAEKRMYMANHNLNLEVIFDSVDILIPDSAQINVTNAVSGYGSLGVMANNCRAEWDRPPNFLLVDYYDKGDFAGSVFEVAAEMNNVTYDEKCCGMSSDAPGNFKFSRVSSWLIGTVLFTTSLSYIL